VSRGHPLSMHVRPRRSVLYMPGSNARALEKAKTLAADALILDLEDSVAPEEKRTARGQVAAAVKAGGYFPREVVVRINALDTMWGADDIVAAAAAGPDAILVPKVSAPEDLIVVGRFLAELGAPAGLKIWAMIETPLSVLQAREIAAAARDPVTRLTVFVLGTNDLAKETRARIVPGRLPMQGFLSIAVLSARAYGIDVIDGVFNDLDDAQGFARECAEARDLGFDGKTLIHPKQIEPCNAVFSPSEAEIVQAKKIVAAFEAPENRDKGVISLDGRMVERLHAEIARRTVAIAEAIAARDASATAHDPKASKRQETR
jgi:citrate lyase subunit beta/citryl-CoA lyase